MNRAGLKSRYCTLEATAAFEDLIQHCNAKYILFSYNNMANKSDVEVFAKKYTPFTTGKSDIRGNEERLFLCNVRRRNEP